VPWPFVAHRGVMFAAFIAMAGSVEAVAPTGRWVVDFADHQCVASRTFGEAKSPWMLAIKPSPTSDVVQLILIRDGGSRDAVQEDVRLTFGKAAPVMVKQLHYAIKGKEFRLINLTAEQATLLANAESIEWAGEGPDKGFSTGPIEQLMRTLSACRADLRDYWNITPDKAALLKAQARPTKPLIRHFSTDDYPRQAVWNREGGVTSVVLLIDEKALIRDCMVDGTSGIATLDAMTCIIFRERATFEPAIDKDGKPVRSSFMQRVRWEMP
jgi:hypothetical protein